MTIGQLQGEEPMHDDFDVDLGNQIDEGGDPPRLWEPNGLQPGCAFSRSIGDRGAKKYGCVADPEIDQFVLKPEDRMLVLASDGVWEFYTNQARRAFFRSCASALKLLLPRRMLWTSFTVICDTAPRWKLSSKVFAMWWRTRIQLGYHARFVADGTRQLKTESKRVPLRGQERSDDITIIGIYIKDTAPGNDSPGTFAPPPSCEATQPVIATKQLPDPATAPVVTMSDGAMSSLKPGMLENAFGELESAFPENPEHADDRKR